MLQRDLTADPEDTVAYKPSFQAGPTRLTGTRSASPRRPLRGAASRRRPTLTALRFGSGVSGCTPPTVDPAPDFLSRGWAGSGGLLVAGWPPYEPEHRLACAWPAHQAARRREPGCAAHGCTGLAPVDTPDLHAESGTAHYRAEDGGGLCAGVGRQTQPLLPYSRIDRSDVGRRTNARIPLCRSVAR